MAIIEESLLEDGEIWVRGPFLGQGGFASVNLAYFPISRPIQYHQIPPIVAVKSTTTDFESLFYEKSIYEALRNSPYLLRCFGDDITASYSGQLSYNLFLEYASGGSLADLIRNLGGFGMAENMVRHVTRSILRGIYDIHEDGFVHCDIKPHNVFIVEDDCELGLVAKIGDFGLTKRDGAAGIGVRGTRRFMAPECLEQNIQGKESDVWALGCVVFSMLTGTLRWRVCPNIVDLLRDDISFKAMDFVLECLQVDPTKRLTASMLLNHPFCREEDASEAMGSEARAEEDFEDDFSNQFRREQDFVSELWKDIIGVFDRFWMFPWFVGISL